MARSYQPNRPEEKTPWGIVVLLLAFISLAFAYSVANPIHEATDELRHYRFARIIATTGRLPVQGQEPCRSQSHHPPLFYALGALATAWIDTGRDICDQPAENPFWAYRYWEVGRDNKNQYLHSLGEAFPWSGEALAAHIIRGINILIGAGVVLLTWATGRAIWPDRPAIALGAAAIAGFNPMFLYMSGAINNDVIAAFSGSAVVFACVVLLADPKRLNWRWGIWLGLLYGLALMSKFNLAVIILLIEGALTWAVLKKPFPDEGRNHETNVQSGDEDRTAWGKRLKLWLAINALLFLVTGLVAGWWFVRNQLLFGEPTGFQELTELWGVRDPRQSLGLAISELPYAWTTLWGRFGFGQIPLPEAIYDGLKVFTALGLIGAILGFIRKATAKERTILLFLAADVLLFSLVLFNYMLV
ncbi:MAG: phospholipid carrier-dependent glycosyltransferase, partial [Chloroflexota bacterium]